MIFTPGLRCVACPAPALGCHEPCASRDAGADRVMGQSGVNGMSAMRLRKPGCRHRLIRTKPSCQSPAGCGDRQRHGGGERRRGSAREWRPPQARAGAPGGALQRLHLLHPARRPAAGAPLWVSRRRNSLMLSLPIESARLPLCCSRVSSCAAE